MKIRVEEMETQIVSTIERICSWKELNVIGTESIYKSVLSFGKSAEGFGETGESFGETEKFVGQYVATSVQVDLRND